MTSMSAQSATKFAGKLDAAQRTTVVSRPHLLRMINNAVTRGQICAVVAPAGAGKSTLLADWQQQAGIPVIWYQLDSTDRDPRRLLEGLVTAIARVFPEEVQAAQRALDGAGPERWILRQLLSALEAETLAIVFDDMHQVLPQQEVRDLFDYFLAQKPNALTPIFLARGTEFPSVLFPSTQKNQWLTLKDLRFYQSETAQLLVAHDLDQSPLGIAFLTERCDGHALQMVLLARTQGEVNMPSFTQEEWAHLPLLIDDLQEEALYHEVLMTVSPKLRSFALETATVGALTATQADTILERTDSAQCYAEAVAQGLFVEQVHEVYRYHGLFADYAIKVLRGADPARWGALRAAGAQWCEQQGDLVRAYTLLAETKDWEQLAGFLKRNQYTLWDTNLWNTIVHGVQQLPRAYQTPQLITAAGHVDLQRGDADKARAKAREAFRVARLPGTPEEELLHPLLLEVAVYWHRGCDTEVIEKAQEGLRLAERLGHVGAQARLHDLHGRALLRSGQVAEGCAETLAARTYHQNTQDSRHEVRVLFNLAMRLVEAGQAPQAERYVQEAEALTAQSTTRAHSGHSLHTRALLHLLRGEVAAAQVAACAAQHLAQEWGNGYLECLTTAALAEIAAEAQAPDAAQLAHVAKHFAGQVQDHAAYYDALRAWILATLDRGDSASAQSLIHKALHSIPFADDGGIQRSNTIPILPIDAAIFELLDGVCFLQHKAHAAACQVFAKITPKLEALHQPHYAARGYLCWAEALLATGQHAQVAVLLNKLAPLVGDLECVGFLALSARWFTGVLAGWQTFTDLDTAAKGFMGELTTRSRQMSGNTTA